VAELWDVVDRVKEHVAAGHTAFWKRGPYRAGGNYSTDPHWHRVASIEPMDKLSPNAYSWTYRWTALCGYSHDFDGILGKKPEVRAEVKTKKLRCAKCDAAAAKAAKEKV
jgi:hypothetical protein